MSVRAEWWTGSLQTDPADDPFAVDVKRDGTKVELHRDPVPISEWLAPSDLAASDGELVGKIEWLAGVARRANERGLCCDIRQRETGDDGHLPCIECPLGDQNMRAGGELAPHCRNGRRLEALHREAERRIELPQAA